MTKRICILHISIIDGDVTEVDVLLVVWDGRDGRTGETDENFTEILNDWRLAMVWRGGD